MVLASALKEATAPAGRIPITSAPNDFNTIFNTVLLQSAYPPLPKKIKMASFATRTENDEASLNNRGGNFCCGKSLARSLVLDVVFIPTQSHMVRTSTWSAGGQLRSLEFTE